MFNSPLQFCPVCKEQVALDQTKEECAHEQRCKVDNCPLAHLFINPDGGGSRDEKPGPDGSIRKAAKNDLT